MHIMERLRSAISDTRVVGSGYAAGLKIVARRADPNFARGTYERPLQDAIASNLGPGGVFYDIGANIGFFSLIAARCVGSEGQVYSFEPVPENAASIARNAHLNDFATIEVFCEAVGATVRSGEMLLARHIGGATLDSVGPPPDPRGRITVDVITIDDVIAQGGLRPPTLVKIDVEGAELDVLAGMRGTLCAHRPTLIYEIDDASPSGLERSASETADFLKQAGYLTMPLPAAYPNDGWYVAHFLARPADV